MSRARRRVRTARFLAAAAACALAAARPPATWAQAVDLGPGSQPGAVEPGGYGAAPGGSLLPIGPPQPPGIAINPGALPTQPGQTLSDRLAGALGKPFATSPGAPEFQITPSLGAQQGWTSNVFSYPGLPTESAFFTSITPAINVTADTQRLLLNATYNPNLIIYEPSRGQNTVAQNLNVQAHSTVVPDDVLRRSLRLRRPAVDCRRLSGRPARRCPTRPPARRTTASRCRLT